MLHLIGQPRQFANPVHIEIPARSVYGATVFDPANETARMLAAIAGTKTLTLATLRHARAMGINITLDGDATLAAMIAGRQDPAA
jgi:nitrous oxidase accessory protein NosD